MIIQGDCLIELKKLPSNSVDSIVTDPPYELGFMGKSWDKTGIANNVLMWSECLRVLKPGGHLLAFSGTRTYHRMASAIEDAGFEVRDMIEWVYGSGFPKSLNIGKAIDKLQGRNREDEIEFANHIKETREKSNKTSDEWNKEFGYVAGCKWWETLRDNGYRPPNREDYEVLKTKYGASEKFQFIVDRWYPIGEKTGTMIRSTAGFSNEQVPRPWKEKVGEEIDTNALATEVAKQWEGWGTSLKPSHEPVICCAKPLTIELIFAKMGIDITNEIINLCQKYNVNVKDVEQALNSIHLKLEKAGVNTVAENARTCDWENIESVVIAGMSFTSLKPISKEPPEGYKVVSAPVSANQNGNEYLQENETLIGTAEDLSEQMDILLSTLATRNIDSNTVWLWKSILENVLQKAGTFTTSMALKTTIAWKTYKSLLSENTQNSTSIQNSTSPAHEPICMARKPLAEKTVAENVLKWGTGGINIDESRVGTSGARFNGRNVDSDIYGKYGTDKPKEIYGYGRFPANLIHDNSDEVRECFPETKTGKAIRSNSGGKNFGGENTKPVMEDLGYDDTGGNASRFFKSIIYNPKASKSERNKGCEGLEEKQYSHDGREKEIENAFQRNKSIAKNNHPTVKPIVLMEYLIKMVTLKGGTVLDPFMGSGSTGVAAKKNGYDFIGIELDKEYSEIAEKRINSFLL